MTDSEIIEAIKNGDGKGMDALLKQYTPLMRYVISPILNNTHDTEDCIHDAAMRVWNKIRLYDGQKRNKSQRLSFVFHSRCAGGVYYRFMDKLYPSKQIASVSCQNSYGAPYD